MPKHCQFCLKVKTYRIYDFVFFCKYLGKELREKWQTSQDRLEFEIGELRKLKANIRKDRYYYIQGVGGKTNNMYTYFIKIINI